MKLRCTVSFEYDVDFKNGKDNVKELLSQQKQRFECNIEDLCDDISWAAQEDELKIKVEQISYED